MVVGARQTKSATSTVMVTVVPAPAVSTLYREKAYRVAETTMKTAVRPMRRMLSAISLGVFCRFAPSIRPIMWSRNPSPGFALTRMMSQSERMLVPPVTALRSPPDSRMTGALSPVMALSLTDAIPSITSPSTGIVSPALT